MDEVTESTPSAEKTRPGVLSIIGIILCVVFGFMFLCNIVIIIKGALSPDEPPTVLGFTPLTVISGSMSDDAEDHIEVGDLIFINKVDPENLHVGNIIAFQKGSSIITHRIIQITTAENGDVQFLTKGAAKSEES